MSELIAGLLGMLVWGTICSIYVLRDRQVTLVMMMPFVLFIALIAYGVGEL